MGLLKKDKDNGYISAKESHRIAKENRKITGEIEKKRNRKHIPEEEYITKMKNPDNCVEFDNVHTYFFTDIGTVKAVDGVSFDVPQGKTVGIVGESGCGKSVTSLSLMQLVQRPTGQTVEGEIRFDDGNRTYNIVNTPTSVMQKLRGNYMSMIFQEPMTSLNPVFRIGDQVDEVIALHYPEKSKEEVKARTLEMLEMVGIANKEGVYRMYPHELSGGMRQRIMIAMALACDPKLIIADEPTTALDVTIQTQIVELLKDINKSEQNAMLFITHDLNLARRICHKIVVMKDGVVQQVDTPQNLYNAPGNLFVAGFIGSPQMNFLDAKVKVNGNDVTLTVGKYNMKLPASKAKAVIDGGYDGKTVVMGIRPENVHDSQMFIETSKDSVVECKINVYELLGAEVYLYFDCEGFPMTARVDPRTTARSGDTVKFALDMEKVHLFDKETEITITN